MRRSPSRRRFGGILLATVATTAVGQAQTSAPGRDTAGEWPSYHRDLAGTRYSPLDQIGPANVARLTLAWSWAADSTFGPPELRNQSTPLQIRGTLYFTTGLNRSVVAADARTGQARWVWRMDEGPRATVAPRRGSGRGVSYWTNGKSTRIFVVTPGFQLVALDPATGRQVAGFGERGIVDLKRLIGVPLDVDSAVIGNSSPPLVVDDLVIVGPALAVGLQPPSRRNVPGRVLAIDARTGALRWRFNPIPAQGEFGNDTWLNGSWRYTGNAGVWAPMSLDIKRRYLYLPVEAATGDFYGGHRPGDNLFSTTVVCLDARTGRRVWHYQLIHHDIWDRDIPTSPILADLMVDGRRIEALVQLTKQAYAYVLDRVTGHPVWPIVERPVPQTDVPGERTAPTQPIPTKPAGYDRQGVTIDDLIDFTPRLRAKAIELIKPYRLGQVFSPPSLRAAGDGTRGTLWLPGTLGGTNWEHGAFDPTTRILYVPSHTGAEVIALEHDSVRSDMDYILSDDTSVPSVDGLPLIKPPYSRITAIDLDRGDQLWQIPSGDTPTEIAEHPALTGLQIPTTGAFGRPVVLVTATLLFTAEGTEGAPILHALDKQTGREIARIDLPGVVGSQPMTYRVGGRQFVAFWITNRRATPMTRLIALALPTP